MSRKEFIRLNTNDNFLSFGNLFRIIKEESQESNTFIQSDLFSIIFDTADIADSTVNNYCTGFRAINPIYKKYFRELKLKYEKNKKVLINVVSKIIELIDKKEIDSSKITLEEINSNSRLNHICSRLYSISKNDSDVPISLSNKLLKLLEKNDFYEFICEVLFFVIFEKKQPINIEDELKINIEKNIYDTNISVNNIRDYINLQLTSGIWAIREIKELAKKNNPFACFEIASMECYGIITGKPRYEEAYKYYKIAEEYNHPVASWAIGYLYYNGYIGNKSKKDLYYALKYFNKAKRLKCSNAYNSLGLLILNGNVAHIKENKELAIKYFEKAIKLGNVYAYNNLGKIAEEEEDYKKAFEYYKISADFGESWAENKVGEFFRKGIGVKRNEKQAYKYYLSSSESSNLTLCKYSKYNLAKYFYENGNIEANIEKDINKAISYLEEIEESIFDACKELIFIYYSLYIKSNKENKYYYEKMMEYKEKCEKREEYNSKVKSEIEEKLIKLKREVEEIKIPK